MHKNQEQMHLPYAQSSATIAFMQKEPIKKRLDQLIKLSGKRPTEIARHAGVSQSTLSRILSGKIEHPSERQIDPLAKYFGITGDQLRGREPLPDGKLFGLAADNAVKIFGARENLSPKESNVAPAPRITGEAPVISWVQAGAWTEIGDLNALTDERVPLPPGASDETFALRVRGQSMLPKYEPDLIIYVDPAVAPFDGDDVVAVLTDTNEATFKQLVEEPGGHRLLKARNPSWPEPWVSINGNCNIIGVVVGSLWLRKPRSQ